jgi:hypothetical protein
MGKDPPTPGNPSLPCRPFTPWQAPYALRGKRVYVLCDAFRTHEAYKDNKQQTTRKQQANNSKQSSSVSVQR